MFDDLIGKPFKFSARGPEAYDCWGLVMEICKRLGATMPDFGLGCLFLQEDINQAKTKFEDKFSRINISDALPGDIIAFRFPLPMWVGHIGVYINWPYFMHTRQSTGVIKERSDTPIWRKRMDGIYRYVL